MILYRHIWHTWSVWDSVWDISKNRESHPQTFGVFIVFISVAASTSSCEMLRNAGNCGGGGGRRMVFKKIQEQLGADAAPWILTTHVDLLRFVSEVFEGWRGSRQEADSVKSGA